MAGSLTFLSTYLESDHADYVMYVRAYDKHATSGRFAAVAILWRAGKGNAPLADGTMAALVSAQSFGSKPLGPETIIALGKPYGHLPGVPAPMLALQQPQNIVVPRAELLQNVEMMDGSTFVVDNEADLVVDLGTLQFKLQHLKF